MAAEPAKAIHPGLPIALAAPAGHPAELVSQPGVIDIKPADVRAMVGAGRAAKAAGLVISWELMHAPMDGVEALAEALGPRERRG